MPSTLRVAFAVDNLQVGGTELNAVRTAERLVAAGLHVRLYHLQSDGPLLARYHRAGIPTTHMPVRAIASFSALRCMTRVAAQLRQDAVDVLHTHDLYTNLLAAPAARWVGVPRIVVSRRWLDSSPRPELLTADRVVSYRMAHAVLANSTAIAERLIRVEGVPRRKVTVIPNFADDQAFAPLDAAQRAAWRVELGVPPDSTVLGCVARLAPVKDHETLLRGFAHLATARPGLHLLLIGDGPERSALTSLVGQLELAGRVTFAGMQANDRNLHGLLDVSLLTSRSEAFPNAVVEAMAAGVPVVATSVGGVPEAVESGVTGVLIPPGEPLRLAQAVRSLLDDPEGLARMGLSARARAHECYGADAVVARLLALYREGLPTSDR